MTRRYISQLNKKDASEEYLEGNKATAKNEIAPPFIYKCYNCRKECNQVYSENKNWVCEKCYDKI